MTFGDVADGHVFVMKLITLLLIAALVIGIVLVARGGDQPPASLSALVEATTLPAALR